MQLLAMTETGTYFRGGGDRQSLRGRAPGRIYHFAAFLNQLLSQTALTQEYEGRGALPRDCCTSDRRVIAEEGKLGTGCWNLKVTPVGA
jgi:hypothetical protein